VNLQPDDPGYEASAVEAISEGEARFERWRKRSGVIVAPLGFLTTWLLTAGRLPPQGRSLAAILAAVAVLWITELIPLPVTALAGAVLCIVLGVADAKTVLAPFADPIVFLFIGSFILARAMMLHGLNRRIALAILSLRWVGGRPARVLAAMGLVTALVSMWVSNTATTAMMLPIGLGILQTLHQVHGGHGDLQARNWPFATCMMLMIAYAASIGGLGTPVGSPPNLIAVGFIRSLAGVEISFFRWMSLAVPTVLVMGVVLFVLLYLLHPSRPIAPERARDLQVYLQSQREALGGWDAGQINTLAAFTLALVLWVTPGFLSLLLAKGHPLAQFLESRVPEAVAAMAAAILLFFLPTNLRKGRFTITWEEAAKIDWGTILLFGGGLSLGTLMFKTGVAEAMGRGVTGLAGGGSVWVLTSVAIGMGIVVSEATSNTAAASMVLPVVIALAQAAQVNPVPPALGTCFGASYGFMLPVSTPPNAIVYSSGLVPITKMMRAGILFDILGFFIIFASLRVLCPLLGLGP